MPWKGDDCRATAILHSHRRAPRATSGRNPRELDVPTFRTTPYRYHNRKSSVGSPQSQSPVRVSRTSRQSESSVRAAGSDRGPLALLVHRKGRMLHSRRFPEHCRTPPGNPPRSWSTALTKAFPVVALSVAAVPSPVARSAAVVGAATVPIRTEYYHDYRSLGFVP